MMRTVVLVCVTGLLISVCGASQSHDYALSLWPCGVVIWPESSPDYAEHFVERLTAAAETAFGFWGYDRPVIAATPHHEANRLRIPDSSTNDVRVIPPLQWGLWEIPPLVVLAFPGEDAMRFRPWGTRTCMVHSGVSGP